MSVLQMEDWAPVNKSAQTQLGRFTAAVTLVTPCLDISAMVSCSEFARPMHQYCALMPVSFFTLLPMHV